MLLSLRLDGATLRTDGRLFEGLYQRDGWLPLFDGPYPHVSIGSGGGDGRERGREPDHLSKHSLAGQR
jgi:hypothetical protein